MSRYIVEFEFAGKRPTKNEIIHYLNYGLSEAGEHVEVIKFSVTPAAPEAAREDRDRRIRLEVLEDVQSFYNESNMLYSEEFEGWLKKQLTKSRAPVPAERAGDAE